MMRYYILIILLLLYRVSVNAQTYSLEQGRADFERNRIALTKQIDPEIQKYFDLAIDEMARMLKGEIEPNFKRAVFLIENAYYEGQVSWADYNDEIIRISKILNKMVNSRGLRKYKTAGNWAIFTYMSDSIPENNFKPYQYDFENFMSDTDRESSMVSRLLKIKRGNCRALPYLYKILANEIGVEACIAIVPMHCYVKHRDEQGNWWNLEMTTGSFSRSSFIMETFNVSETAIKSGLFMKSLSEIESIAYCVYELLLFYELKTGRYSDDYVKKGYELGLQYYPISQLQLLKANDLHYRLSDKMTKMGLKGYRDLVYYPHLIDEYNAMDSTFKYFKEIGNTLMKNEDYERLVRNIKDKQIKIKSKF